MGAQQERLRDREPERIRGLEVDHQLEPRGLLDRELRGFRRRVNMNALRPRRPLGAPGPVT